MGTMSQLYVKCEDEAALYTLRLRFPAAVIEPPSTFASIRCDIATLESASDVTRLAQELDREVVVLAFSSIMDAFHLTHAISGTLKRHLRFGTDEQGLWEEVLGEAEPWEEDAWANEAFHVSPQDEEAWITHVFETGVEPPSVRRIEFEQGGYEPMVDAREAARTAATHYRLTGWNEDWDRMHKGDTAAP